MNILVVGNGFDLAHEFPTSYMDFLTFLWTVQSFLSTHEMNKFELDNENKLSAQDCSCQNINYFLENIIDSLKITYCKKCVEYEACSKSRAGDCEKLLANAHGLIMHNMWLDYFKYVHENQAFSGKRWIDIEAEIKHTISIIKKVPSSDIKNDNRKEIYLNLPISEVITNKNIQGNKSVKQIYIDKLADDLNHLTLFLEEYMRVVDLTTMHAKRFSVEIMGIKAHRLLSFNYTNTYRNLYNQTLADSNCCFIHGKAGKKNLVLGYQSDKDMPANDLSDIRFKKYFQRIYKKTGNEYIRWLNNATTGEDLNVYFFGHSLSSTDGNVIREIMLNQNVKSITIYYHDENSHANQIRNLVKLLGENQVIDFSYHEKLVFKPQLPMTPPTVREHKDA